MTTQPPSSTPLLARSTWIKACLALLAIAAILIIRTAGDYGDSWDEKVRIDSGERKLQYYHAVFSGDTETAQRLRSARDLYPGFHDLSLAVLRRISPLSDHLTGNLFSALLGLATLAGAMFLACRLHGPAAAFLTGILLLCYPGFYGHWYINPKDIPFAFGYVWGLLFIHRWLTSAGTPSWRTVALTGLFIGIAMATRVGGLVLLCYLGLFLLIKVLFPLCLDRFRGAPSVIADALRSQGPKLAIAASISILIMMLYWPYSHGNPLTRTSGTLSRVTQFEWTMPVFFQGSFTDAAELPWYYLPKMFLITTPIVFLILGALGVGIAIRHAVRAVADPQKHLAQLLGYDMVLFAILFPMAYVVVRDSVIYNGTRHLIFIIPPAAVFAGWGAERLLSWIHAHRPHLQSAAIALFVIATGLIGIQMVRLHPYQYIYYNELVGGTANASQRYETDYWGTAYKELASEFYGFLKTTRPRFTRPMVVVNMEHVTWLFQPFLPPSDSLPIVVTRSNPEDADYYAASTLWGSHQFHEGETVVVVERLGIPLALVKDVRYGNSEPPAEPTGESD